MASQRFSEGAYQVARDRCRVDGDGGTLDANWPLGHWIKVKLSIARLAGHDGLAMRERFGLSTYCNGGA